MELFCPAFKTALSRFSRKGGLVFSSHVALSMMLAIFPFCIVVLALAGMLSEAGLQASGSDLNDLLDVVFGSWPDAIADPIENEVRAVLETSGGGTLTLGALLTILFASNGFDAVRQAISAAYHDRDDPRPAWKLRLLAVGFAVFGALLVTVAGLFSVVLPIYLRYVADILPILHLEALSGEFLGTAVTALVMIFALFACHKWLPGVKRPVRALVPGVVLTLILWGICGTGFEFYISNFSTYSVTYAGLAGVMSALVFMYLMAAMFLLGAEFNATLGDLARQKPSGSE
ncbi:YihY/virulence factor BrkB family protein [uncultured Shimia sp.]|uniref:YihY/virulence factor BrkB family protein n=1 Tax=uncultured Shimia sp. TaxID=573152 RepID=UPI00262566B9|nr:YihY/virulence factor BrkB family protein [uncultured Shimia sp.]